MKALFTSMLQALAQGEGVVLCSILASSGSTPRGAGAKMAVFADGHTEGTVGGGAVELESGKLAMEVLKTKQSLVHGYCLAPNEVADIGMICGGNVTVFFQYFDPQAEADTALLRGILELLNGNQNSWLVYRMDDGCVSAMGTYDEAHGLRFTDCITPDELRPMLRADAVTKKGEPRYYVEPLTRAGYAYIFGGGHVGAALVPVLASVDFRVVVYDNRPGFATPEHYPQAERVILGDYLDIGAHLTLTENDYVCIMTPGHPFDHLLVNGFSHFLALFELLFMRAKRALNLAEKRDGAGTSLVEEKSRVVERADVFVGVVQKVAVGAAGGGAGAGHVVLALFVGGVGEIHGVAEFAAELRAARPVDDAREDTDAHKP